jgi:hypothetical protein
METHCGISEAIHTSSGFYVGYYHTLFELLL